MDTRSRLLRPTRPWMGHPPRVRNNNNNNNNNIRHNSNSSNNNNNNSRSKRVDRKGWTKSKDGRVRASTTSSSNRNKQRCRN